MISWAQTDLGWFKLNTDGASRGNPVLAAAGGVIRNNDGKCCRGFALNIGRCTAQLAELWGDLIWAVYRLGEENIKTRGRGRFGVGGGFS